MSLNPRQLFSEITFNILDENNGLSQKLEENFNNLIISDKYFTMSIISHNKTLKNEFLKKIFDGSKENCYLKLRELKNFDNLKGVLLTKIQRPHNLFLFELQSDTYNSELLSISLSQIIVFVVDYCKFQEFDLNTLFDQLSRIYLIDNTLSCEEEEKKNIFFLIKNPGLNFQEDDILSQIYEDFNENWNIFLKVKKIDQNVNYFSLLLIVKNEKIINL